MNYEMYADGISVSVSEGGQHLNIPGADMSSGGIRTNTQEQIADIPTESKDIATENVTVGPSKTAYYASDYLAGLLGGCAGLIFGHPFDTVKVRQQTSGGTSCHAMQCTHNTYKCGGLLGFYRGLAFPLGAEGFRNMIFFGVYGSTMKLLYYEEGKAEGTKPSYTDIMLAGAVGGAMQAIPAVPIELVKVKLQTQIGSSVAGEAGVVLGTERHYNGPVDCIRSIYRNHGMRGVFRGFNSTLLRDTTGFATYITSYEFLCTYLAEDENKPCSIPSLLLAGGCAGTLSWLVNMPVDVVKSRMQSDCLAFPKYKCTLDCVVDSYKNEGITVFWRGLPVTCLRAFPVNAVTFAVYSLTLRWMGEVLHCS